MNDFSNVMISRSTALLTRNSGPLEGLQCCRDLSADGVVLIACCLRYEDSRVLQKRSHPHAIHASFTARRKVELHRRKIVEERRNRRYSATWSAGLPPKCSESGVRFCRRQDEVIC